MTPDESRRLLEKLIGQFNEASKAAGRVAVVSGQAATALVISSGSGDLGGIEQYKTCIAVIQRTMDDLHKALIAINKLQEPIGGPRLEVVKPS